MKVSKINIILCIIKIVNNINYEQKQEKKQNLKDVNIELKEKKRKNSNINKKSDKQRFLTLNDNEIKEYINLRSQKPIYKTNPNTKIRTKYIYKAKTKNYIYYTCKKNKLCDGKAKIDINKKLLIITEECSTNIEHEIILYEEFLQLYEEKKFEEIDFKNRKIQKYFTIYAISKDNNIDNAELKKLFNKITQTEFILDKVTLSKLRNKLLEDFKSLTIEQLLDHIQTDIPNLSIYILDITYNIKIKNNDSSRYQRLIFFGLKENFKIIKNLKEYFMDVTFQIIPK